MSQASLPLQRAGLDPALLQALSAKSFKTAGNVLTVLPLDLMETLDTPQPKIEALLRAVAAAAMPTPVSALDMLRMRQSSMSHLATQLEGLDRLLRGGVASGSVTELVGAAGVGKTQLCLQLTAIAATLGDSQPGTQPGVVYFDTERGRFSAKRLRDIASERFPEVYTTPASLTSLLSRIHVSTPDTTAGLLHQLQELGRSSAQNNIKLVVIDSIAALVKKEERMASRQQNLGEQAAALKSLAEKCRIPVVVTNQVTTVFRAPKHDFDASSRPQSGGQLSAALGPQWAHAVNTRLVLEGIKGVRWIKVAKSPVAPAVGFSYDIGAGGLQLLDGEPMPTLALGGSLAFPVSNEMF